MVSTKGRRTPAKSAPPVPEELPAILRYDAGWLEQGFAAAAVFASIVALALAASGALLRAGFSDNSLSSWALCVGLSWFLVHFSFLVRQALRWAGMPPGGHWWASHAALSLAALAIAALCGVESPAAARAAELVLVALGCVGCAGRLVWLVTRVRWRDVATVLGFAACFGVYAVGASWGNGYGNPAFVEGMVNGRAQIDTLFHASLANMLRTYGVPSTGLDGLKFVHYHFGSHWLFGKLANLLDVGAIDFYCRGYAILFVPFGVFSLAALALTIPTRWQSFRELADPISRPAVEAPSQKVCVAGPLFWFVLMVVYVGFLPFSAGFLSAVSQNSVVISESFGVGIAVALLAIAVAFSFFRDSYDSPDLWIADRVLGILALPAIAGAIGFLKVSIMLVLTAASAVLYVRVWRHIYRKAAAGTLLLAAAALVCVAYIFTSNPEYAEMARFTPFGFLKGNVAPGWWSYFWLVYFAWSWIFVFVRLREEGISTLGELTKALREGRILDVEFLAAIAVIGAGPGLVLTSDSSTHYFSDVQRWVAAGLLLAAIIRRLLPRETITADGQRLVMHKQGASSAADRERRGGLRITTLFVAVGLAALAGTMVFNAATLLDSAVAAAVSARGIDWNDDKARARLLDRGLLQAFATVEARSKPVEERLKSDKNVIAVLRDLDKLPLSEKRRSLIYIPKSNTHYWGLLHGPYFPKDGPFVAPALSGIAMIDGLYERPEGDFWSGYGYQHYECPIVNVKRPPLAEYLPVLRSRCAGMGFTQLLVIESDADGVSHVRKFDCGQTKEQHPASARD